MRTRFYNARILTMCEDTAPEILEGELWIENEKIVYCGDAEGLEDYESLVRGHWDNEIDCHRNLLMPGFKNAHTHSAMTFLRSSADDMPLGDWLNNQVFPYEARLQPEDIYELTKLAILEYLTSGMTAAMEMYMQPTMVARAFREFGFRVVQVGAMNNFSQSPEEIEEWFHTLNGNDDLTSFRLGFHAEYTTSPERIAAIADLAHKYEQPVFVHVSETRSETDGCIERYGRTTTQYLADMGIWDYGGAGYHLVHTTPEDWAVLRERHVGVVSCPGSNTKLASGIAPLTDYLREGVLVGLGTDGPASNNCLDMFREMFLATGLQKLRNNDAASLPAYDVLRMATCNSARIMTLDDCDVLEPGKKADLIMIDLNQPNMQPINHIANNLVYSGSKLNVIMTMVNGKILYDRFDGRMNFHVGEDAVDIYRDCENIKKRILNR